MCHKHASINRWKRTHDEGRGGAGGRRERTRDARPRREGTPALVGREGREGGVGREKTLTRTFKAMRVTPGHRSFHRTVNRREPVGKANASLI